MPTLKRQLDCSLKKKIALLGVRRSRAVWDIAFESDHSVVLLSFMVRFQKRNSGAQLMLDLATTDQLMLDLAGLKNEDCRKKFGQRVSINIGLPGPGREWTTLTLSLNAFKMLQSKRFKFEHRGRNSPSHLRRQYPRTSRTSRTEELEKTWRTRTR
ncbi:hypothetical protein RB195_015899 [Necator americanus]|uniref:Uncharacterized protein n=1 Tax=Necator americanus TaxID=51031 RepID=A0ABR1E6N9_NECAM